MTPLIGRTVGGLVVFCSTIACVIVRPWGLNEAWPAAGGAAVLLALGFLRPLDLVAVGGAGSVPLFLLGMLIVSAILELAGVFAWAAFFAVRASGASARRLLVNTFLLGAAVTGLLSLDVTVANVKYLQ